MLTKENENQPRLTDKQTETDCVASGFQNTSEPWEICYETGATLLCSFNVEL